AILNRGLGAQLARAPCCRCSPRRPWPFYERPRHDQGRMERDEPAVSLVCVFWVVGGGELFPCAPAVGSRETCSMSENIKTVVVIVGILIGLPVALLFARDWFTRPSNKKMEEYSRQFVERVQNPDFAAVEKHFGCPLPECVQALYANREELMRGDFEVAASAD